MSIKSENYKNESEGRRSMFFFGNGIDKKMLYIILAVLVVISLANAGSGFWIETILTIPAVIIAMTFHEFAHAWMANHFGDTTPKAQGRLTLNPASHIDPFGFVLLLFAGVGWGRPVMINPNQFTSNRSRATCEALVSLAGPVMNFILAILFTILYFLLGMLGTATGLIGTIALFVLYTIYINIGLGVFNLIPLPPLDGEKIFRNVLPYNAIQWLDNQANTLQLVFMILWITGLLGYIVTPVVSFLSNLLFSCVGAVFALF